MWDLASRHCGRSRAAPTLAALESGRKPVVSQQGNTGGRRPGADQRGAAPREAGSWFLLIASTAQSGSVW